MRGKNQRVVFMAVAAVLIGLGYLLHTLAQGSLYRELTDERKKVESQLNKLKEANAAARAAADEAAAKEKMTRNEAKRAEAEKAKSENERAAAEAKAAAAKQEKENLEEQRKLTKDEAERAKKAEESAVAEQKRLEAEKVASEAKAKELAEQRAKDEVELKKAEAARAKSDADAARALAEQKKAEAAKVKSANDLQAAQKLAAARRDERLLMYKRGGESGAERKEIQRAEKLLKAMEAWEAGLLSPENLAAANALPSVEEAEPVPESADSVLAEEQKKLEEQEDPPPPDPQEEKIKALLEKRAQGLNEEKRRNTEAIVGRYEPLYLAAVDEGRSRDSTYYLSILKSMVPQYEPPKKTPPKRENLKTDEK